MRDCIRAHHHNLACFFIALFWSDDRKISTPVGEITYTHLLLCKVARNQRKMQPHIDQNVLHKSHTRGVSSAT